MTIQKRQTHLEYYKQHSIAPVRYDLSSMDAHLERREALYSKLGLLPLTFRGSSILEVAAGTGHNSLYLAQQMPSRLVLLEPNPTAVLHIKEAYAAFDLPHVLPTVVTETLEHFFPEHVFDIVLCENWLGTSSHEVALMRKLASFVAPRGVLVVTTVSPIGFIPNLLRRFLVPYLAPHTLEFLQRTTVLERAFESHLKSLGAMTRSATDWVQDNMLNPAYFGLCLSSPEVLEQLSIDFEIVGSSPSIAEDWRWFKGLYGDGRQCNEHFLTEYWGKCHNFLDCRAPTFDGDITANQELERIAIQILQTVEMHEDAHLHPAPSDPANAVVKLQELLSKLLDRLPQELDSAHAGLNEFIQLLDVRLLNELTSDMVSSFQQFSGLFGRETSYIALQRRE